MTLPSSGPISLGAIRAELGSSSSNFDMAGHPSDMVIGNNNDANRKLSDFYGKSVKIILGSSYGTSLSIATHFPQVITGDCFYVDLITTGGWDNAQNNWVLTLKYGTSSSGSWGSGTGGKADYWSFNFDGATATASGYYCCSSTNYAWTAENFARIQYAGTGLSPTYYQYGGSAATYYASYMYR